MWHWIMIHWWVWIIALIMWLTLDCVHIWFDAWMEFNETPKVPMKWCHKHGAFKKENTLPLFPELGGTAENANVCPTCYYEAVWKNPNVRLNK
jgi:hypothetical protein